MGLEQCIRKLEKATNFRPDTSSPEEDPIGQFVQLFADGLRSDDPDTQHLAVRALLELTNERFNQVERRLGENEVASNQALRATRKYA